MKLRYKILYVVAGLPVYLCIILLVILCVSYFAFGSLEPFVPIANSLFGKSSPWVIIVCFVLLFWVFLGRVYRSMYRNGAFKEKARF